MLIVCPACASEYEIETDRLGAEGRSVRCAACRETWFVTPDAVGTASASADNAPADGGDGWAGSAQAPLEAAAAETSSVDRTAGAPTIIDQPSPPRRAREGARGRGSERARPAGGARKPAWRRLLSAAPAITAGLVVFVAVPLALLGRSAVVGAMPRSAGLFAAVGLPVNLRGIEIRDVVAFRNPAEAGKPAQLVVEGDLVGVGRERVAMAALEIEILDAAERPLFRWTAPAPRAALESAETARFRASLPSPPLQSSRVEVRFADARAGDSASETKRKGPGASPVARLDGTQAPAEPTHEAAHPAAPAGHASH